MKDQPELVIARRCRGQSRRDRFFRGRQRARCPAQHGPGLTIAYTATHGPEAALLAPPLAAPQLAS